MRRLTPPSFDVGHALDACLSHKSEKDVARFEQIRAELLRAQSGYIAHGNLGTLYQIAETRNIGVVNGDEMTALYTGTFSRKKTHSRDLYDKLKQGAPNGICPLCGSQQVKTLDHYLAKTKHASLTITPINLVPCCSDCNKAKSNAQAATGGDQHLHPYFDDVDDAEWLFADVVEASPPSLVYRADPPQAWPAAKRQRVVGHFSSLAHGFLFASLSSDQLPSMRHRLRRLFTSGGAGAVRAHLEEELHDCRQERRNSWQIAMYAGLVASDWYCDGGFAA